MSRKIRKGSWEQALTLEASPMSRLVDGQRELRGDGVKDHRVGDRYGHWALPVVPTLTGLGTLGRRAR